MRRPHARSVAPPFFTTPAEIERVRAHTEAFVFMAQNENGRRAAVDFVCHGDFAAVNKYVKKPIVLCVILNHIEGKFAFDV